MMKVITASVLRINFHDFSSLIIVSFGVIKGYRSILKLNLLNKKIINLKIYVKLIAMLGERRSFYRKERKRNDSLWNGGSSTICMAEVLT